jgi:hypothetical protein
MHTEKYFLKKTIFGFSGSVIGEKNTLPCAVDKTHGKQNLCRAFFLAHDKQALCWTFFL